MPIGPDGAAVSHISQAHPDRVEVRGRDLTGDLMGRLSFTEYFHLLLTGEEPTEEQAFFLDLLLVAIAEHGMMPTNVAARMTLAADPGSLQGAVAAGILGCGPVILGTAADCARLLDDARTRVAEGAAPAEVTTEAAAGGPRRGRAPTRVRPPRAQAARPARRAHPRARRRPRRQWSARGACAPLPRRRGGGLGTPAHDERVHADRRRDARPRLPDRDREGGARSSRGPRACSPTSPRSGELPIGFLMAGRAEEAVDYERLPEDGAR